MKGKKAAGMEQQQQIRTVPRLVGLVSAIIIISLSDR
jgi:hypothetical protein